MADAAPARGCGECGLCCKLLSAPSLGKPPRKWCTHFRRRSGCDIYADRPAECRGFNCGWLLTPSLPDDWRPDRAGFLLHQDEGRIIVGNGTTAAWIGRATTSRGSSSIREAASRS